MQVNHREMALALIRCCGEIHLGGVADVVKGLLTKGEMLYELLMRIGTRKAEN